MQINKHAYQICNYKKTKSKKNLLYFAILQRCSSMYTVHTDNF